MANPIKLQPRTTYTNGWGRTVNIAGPTGETIEGQPVFWSIQGDHYAQDGRFVNTSRLDNRAGDDPGLICMKRYLLGAHFRSNIASEDTSKAARDWWIGVDTSPRKN